MVEEIDTVVLTLAVPEEGLECGDAGTVVHAYQDGQALEVEFMTLDGKTAAVDAKAFPEEIRRSREGETDTAPVAG